MQTWGVRQDKRSTPWLNPPASIVFSTAAATLTLTYISQATNATNQTIYDFGNFTMPRGGLALVSFVSRGSLARTVTSVSIGGTNGTIYDTNASDNFKRATVARVVTSGVQNVTVTLSASNGANCAAAVGVWLLENYTSSTPVGSSGAVVSTAAVASISAVFNFGANDYGVYGHMHRSSDATTWNTATEEYDAVVADSGGVDNRISFADKFSSAAITPHTETSSWGSSAGATITGGSWG